MHAIPAGARVDSGGLVTRANGSTYQLPTCQYPAYPNFSAHNAGQVSPLDFSGNTSRVEWTWDTLPGSNRATKFTANWRVPAAPVGSYSGGTAYYTFPALEYATTSSILMPALQYGTNAWFGGSYWTAASWYCRGTSCYYSARQISPAANDTVFGSMVASNCSTGHLGLHCDWTVQTKYRHNGSWVDSTSLTETSVLGTFATADAAAVDVDSITSCNQYPAPGVSYWNVALYDTTGYQRQPGTVWWVDTVTSGVSPSCYFGMAGNGYSIFTAWHNDPPPTVAISGPTSVTRSVTCFWASNPSGGAPPLSFEWYPGGQLTQDVDTSFYNSGWLKAVVTDTRSRQGSDSLYVTVNTNLHRCPS